MRDDSTKMVPVVTVLPDGARTISVGSWSLRAERAEDEPRVRDLDLAGRLGYDRPRDIRRLVERLTDEGKLNASEVRVTVTQTTARGGRPGKEYWLTEAQALKVVAKSETPKADALLDEVIHVYMQARRGLLPQQHAFTVAMIAETARAVVAEVFAPLREELAQIRRDLSQLPQGTISGFQADELRAAMEYIALGLVALGDRATVRGAKTHIRERLKTSIGWGTRGTHLHTMPAAKFAEARAALSNLRMDIDGRLKARRKTVRAREQHGLFDAMKAN